MNRKPATHACTLLCSVIFMVPGQAVGVEFLGSEVNDSAFTALLLLQAFLLAIVLVLYRQQMKLVRLLKTESRTDHLTHIANRRHFFEVLDSHIAMAERHQQPLCLLTLDIDHFKQVNDTHGHPAGDTVLRKVAFTLKKALRKGDFIGRLGGEEFGILLPMTAPDTARHIAERLLTQVASLEFPLINDKLQVTCSIGLSGYQPGMSADSLSQASDQALYASKQSGRNCVATHHPPSTASQPVNKSQPPASGEPAHPAGAS